jgi:magnesium and cobalt transporter
MIALLLSHDLPAGQDRRFAEELDRFLALGQVRLQQIMIPRAAVVTLPASATVAECALVARRSGHSRLPVVEADGRVIGWILARDLLFTHVLPTAALPPGLLRSNLLADADLTPYELLEEMQWRRQQMAIVVDRGGEPLGLVTLENLVEAVVGRIEDEFDRPAAAPAAEGRRSPAAHGAG